VHFEMQCQSNLCISYGAQKEVLSTKKSLLHVKMEAIVLT